MWSVCKVCWEISTLKYRSPSNLLWVQSNLFSPLETQKLQHGGFENVQSWVPLPSGLIERVSERTLSCCGISQIHLFPRVRYFLPRRSQSVRGGWVIFSPLFLLPCNPNSTHCLLWPIHQGWNQGISIFSWNGGLVLKIFFFWSGHVSGFLSAPFHVFSRATMGGKCSYLWFAAGETEAELGLDSGISDSTRHWCLMVLFGLSLTPSFHCCCVRPVPWVDGVPTLHPRWFLKYVHSSKYWNLSSLRIGTSSFIATVYPHCPKTCLTHGMHIRIPGMING